MRHTGLMLDTETELLVQGLALKLRRYEGKKLPLNSPKDFAHLLLTSSDSKNFQIRSCLDQIKSNIADGSLAKYLNRHGVDLSVNTQSDANQDELVEEVKNPLATDVINQKVKAIFQKNDRRRHLFQLMVKH